MFAIRKEAVATIIGSFIWALAGGCALLPGMNEGQVASAPPTSIPVAPSAKAPAEPVARDDEDVLAAVETFLERTRDYQTSEVSTAPTALPVPSGQAVAMLDRPEASVADATYMPGQAHQQPAAKSAMPVSLVYANAQVAIREPEPVPSSLPLPVVESVSVEVPMDVGGTPSTPIVGSTANASLDVRPVGGSADMQAVVARLEKQAREEGGFDAEWRLRLMQLALHRDAEAEAVSGTVAAEERGLLASLIRVGAAIRGLIRDPLGTGRLSLERIDELRRVVADRADPIVTAVTLCRKVVTFGVYEEMGAMDFPAGRTLQTIVYSEVANFRSEETEDGQHRTRLATRLELLTTEGESVWRHEEPEIVDVCRRRRNDFFIAQRVTLPSTLTAGNYVLKVLVEDRLSGKADEATYPLTIGGAVSSARGG